MPKSTNDLSGSNDEGQGVATEPADEGAADDIDAEPEDYSAPEETPDEGEGEGAADQPEETPASPEPEERKVYTPAGGAVAVDTPQWLKDAMGDEIAGQITEHAHNVATATFQKLQSEQNQFQGSMRQKGWSRDMIDEYGTEVSAVANTLPPEIRTGDMAPVVALHGAILNRVAQGADLATELERAAGLIRTGKAPAPVAPVAQPKPRPALQPSVQRASQVTTRSDRPASVNAPAAAPALTRRAAAMEYLMKNDGYTRDQALEATKPGQK